MTDCCLPDIRIAQLPRVKKFSYKDLLVLDVKIGGTDVYETRAIAWGDLLGIGTDGPDPGGDPDLIIPNPDNIIILNGTVKFIDGTELRPSITFIKDDNTGIYRPGDNTIGFTTGGTRVVVFKENNVGIGTDFPLEKLHIQEGNLRIDLDDADFNVLWAGSSNLGRGGNPSIQSLGPYPLQFHVNSTLYYAFTLTGALEINAGGAMDSGTPGYLLESQGASAPPRWKNPDDIFDLSWIIGEIDTKYIGKGHLTIFPQPTTIGSTPMTSGVVYKDKPEPTLGIEPNANAFEECGWELNVDETVLRTGGDQVISGKKIFDPFNTPWSDTVSQVVMEKGSSIMVNAGAVEQINAGGELVNRADGLMRIQNDSNFLFYDLEPLP